MSARRHATRSVHAAVLLAAVGAWSLLACLACATRAAADDPRATTAEAGKAPQTAALERALRAPGLRGATVGVLVARLDDGTPVFARGADRRLVPASNLKLVTALAALETFGPSHRFVTRIRADAEPDAEGAVETLYVEGDGDPALTSEELWRLAADLHRGGLRRVRKGLVIDDSALDAERWNPAWGEVTSRAYYAPVGAFSVNYGAFAVEVRPGPAPGTPAQVAIDPPVAYLRLHDVATTTLPGRGASLVVDRRAGAGHERVDVSGRVPAGAGPQVVYRSVADPALYAAAVLRMQLEAVGVQVGEGVARGRAPETAPELLAFEGRPLGQVVNLFVKHSTNVIAETLFKQLGRQAGVAPGSWAGGREAVLASLGRLGIDTGDLEIVDGSGLARDDRITPRVLVEVLRRAHASFAFGPELVAALPIAARDGTLEKRARGAAGAVRAKTGLLDGVTGLSGFARRADGEELVFSILANGYRGGDRAAMDAVDGFVTALVAGPPQAAQAADAAAAQELGVAPP